MAKSALSLIVLLPVALLAQPSTAYLDSADRAYETKDYHKSALYYDSAFSHSGGLDFDYYSAACSHSLAGNVNKSVFYLQKSFESGVNNFDLMYYDKDLNAIRNNPDYRKIEDKYRDKNAVYYFDILRALASQKHVYFNQKRISLNEYFLTQYSLDEIQERTGVKLPFQSPDTLLNFFDHSLEFEGCSFDDHNNSFNSITKLRLNVLYFYNCRGGLSVDNVDVNHLFFFLDRGEENEIRVLKLTNLNQHGVFLLNGRGDIFRVENANFSIRIPQEPLQLSRNQIVDFGDRDGMNVNLEYKSIDMSNVKFINANPGDTLEPFDFHFESERLNIVTMTNNYTSRFRGSVTDDSNVKWSHFPSYADIFQLRLPDLNCYMPFEQFKNTTFVRLDLRENGTYQMAGDSIAEFKDDNVFDNLTSLYKRLYDNYRSRADLTSSNSCYIRMKELEIEHLKLKADKNLEERIRLRLNQIMGFYTNHATSPGKAILISFYIILLFGIFYFFFPSEWDKSTKAQLLVDFRTFVQKNEHGYVRPFIKMTKGFLLSFFNAFTLSVNAFVTLGFGNIPTTGVARYVCVFQGMLGWFLLSLFTVALMNQVLI